MNSVEYMKLNFLWTKQNKYERWFMSFAYISELYETASAARFWI